MLSHHSKKQFVIVLIGPPGAGKGTQARILKERLGYRTISIGDILRANIKANTNIGRIAKPYIDVGKFVPDEISIRLLEDEFNMSTINSNKTSFVLDGFPRTLIQAEALDKMLARLNIPLSVAFSFEADHETLIKRLTGRWTNPRNGRTYHTELAPPNVPQVDDKDGETLIQRADDTYEIVLDRLQTYDERTKPTVDYYDSKGILQKIDSIQNIDNVTRSILNILGKPISI